MYAGVEYARCLRPHGTDIERAGGVQKPKRSLIRAVDAATGVFAARCCCAQFGGCCAGISKRCRMAGSEAETDRLLPGIFESWSRSLLAFTGILGALIGQMERPRRSGIASVCSPAASRIGVSACQSRYLDVLLANGAKLSHHAARLLRIIARHNGELELAREMAR